MTSNYSAGGRRRKTGFLTIDELIQDQGEVAMTLVEDGNGGFTCELYAIPENGKFEQEELRNLYLLQALREKYSKGRRPSSSCELLREVFFQSKSEGGGDSNCRKYDECHL